MFRTTERQLSLVGAPTGLSPGAQQRLKNSWAEGFRQKVMPELLAGEDAFAVLYADGGRPNWSVARLLGVSLLQQLQDMSDQQALDSLSFDVRWQHALDLVTQDAYLSRRSLVEFRRRLVQHDADGRLLRGLFDRICKAGVMDLGIDTTEQRMDSTIVSSNIRARGRLSLARETLRVFVHGLDDAQRTRLPRDVGSWYESGRQDEWEVDGKAHGDASAKQRRLHDMGRLVQMTLDAYAHDEQVAPTERYGLLRRLADEHGKELGLVGVEVVAAADDDEPRGSGDDPPTQGPPATRAAGAKRKRPKQRKTQRSKPGKARYWSAQDPDASFGHKGLGYHVHVAESCRNEGPELLTDYEVVTAAQSDVGQSLPALQRLAQRELTPSTMYADGGYPTPSDLVASRALGSELHAPVNRGRLASTSLSRCDFHPDCQTGEVKRCPAGHAPTRHDERESSDSKHRRRALHVFFDADTCNACEQRDRCPVRQPNNTRSHEYRLELSAELIARDQRWVEQKTEDWKSRYRIRAGVEATMSELKRGHGLGRLRVRGFVRVCIQVALKTTACNIKRWMAALAAPLRALLRLYTAPLTAMTALPYNFAPRLAAICSA
jgi:hypothetical protein